MTSYQTVDYGKWRVRRHGISMGFTLIEILVVIVIIALLSGMVFRMTKVTDERTRKAKTVKSLEAFAAILEEYKAEYGKYPPASGAVTYRWAAKTDTRTLSDIFKNFTGWQDADLGVSVPMDTFFTSPRVSVLYYLIPRDGDGPPWWGSGSMSDYSSPLANGQESMYEQIFGKKPQYKDERHRWTEKPRDKAFKKRIASYWGEGLTTGDLHNQAKDEVNNFGQNEDKTTWFGQGGIGIGDGWGMALRYESLPPYDTYRLWSCGPNRHNDKGEKDDIVTGKEN